MLCTAVARWPLERPLSLTDRESLHPPSMQRTWTTCECYKAFDCAWVQQRLGTRLTPHSSCCSEPQLTHTQSIPFYWYFLSMRDYVPDLPTLHVRTTSDEKLDRVLEWANETLVMACSRVAVHVVITRTHVLMCQNTCCVVLGQLEHTFAGWDKWVKPHCAATSALLWVLDRCYGCSLLWVFVASIVMDCLKVLVDLWWPNCFLGMCCWINYVTK